MSDPVHNPPHYKSGGIEVIDVIEAFDLNFRLANVIKYVLRAGRKGHALLDLKKAAWYLDREIKRGNQCEKTNTTEVDVTNMDDVARRMVRVFLDTSIPSVATHTKPDACTDKQEYDG